MPSIIEVAVRPLKVSSFHMVCPHCGKKVLETGEVFLIVIEITQHQQSQLHLVGKPDPLICCNSELIIARHYQTTEEVHLEAEIVEETIRVAGLTKGLLLTPFEPIGGITSASQKQNDTLN
jgi:hypothetical protein